MSLLKLPIPDFAETEQKVKRALTDAFGGVLDRLGMPITAFSDKYFLAPLGDFFARMIEWLYVTFREWASQAVPWAATGQNLDNFLAADGVVIPIPQAAQLSIAITGQDITIEEGSRFSDGQDYTLNAQVIFGGAESIIQAVVTAEAIGSLYNRVNGETLEYEAVIGTGPGIRQASPVINTVVIGQDPADDDAKRALLKADAGGDTGAGTIAWYQSLVMVQSTSIGQVLVLPEGQGNGTVALYPLLVIDPDEPAYTINLPTAGQLSGWNTTVNDVAKRNVTHRPFVLELPIPAIDMAFTIVPNSPDTQAAALDALNTRFFDERPTGNNPMTSGMIDNSQLIGVVAALDSITSATLTNVTAGIGADIDNVPLPGPDADVFYFASQVLVVGLVAFS